jgi:hypothetical protein
MNIEYFYIKLGNIKNLSNIYYKYYVNLKYKNSCVLEENLISKICFIHFYYSNVTGMLLSLKVKYII